MQKLLESVYNTHFVTEKIMTQSLSLYKPHNQIFYKSSTTMSELRDCSVDLIITSPPYFISTNFLANNIKIKSVNL